MQTTDNLWVNYLHNDKEQHTTYMVFICAQRKKDVIGKVDVLEQQSPCREDVGVDGQVTKIIGLGFGDLHPPAPAF